MNTILISLVIALLITFNSDIELYYDAISNFFFGGKKLAPNETKF